MAVDINDKKQCWMRRWSCCWAVVDAVITSLLWSGTGRGFSAPFPLLVWKEVWKNLSSGECDFFFDSGGLDTSLSCFGHLEQHSAGGRGWRVSSASQDSALRTRWWDAPTYVTVLSCTGPSLSYLSPPPLPVCVLNSSFKIMVKHCLPFLEPSSVTLPSTQNWLDASSLVVSMIPFNYF